MWIFKGVGKQNLNIEYWKNEVKAAMEIKMAEWKDVQNVHTHTHTHTHTHKSTKAKGHKRRNKKELGKKEKKNKYGMQ